MTPENIKNIVDTTKGQYNNKAYVVTKINRLTASNFGAVIKRKESTSCDLLVKSILSEKRFVTAATEYGKINEHVAIKKFEEFTGKSVASAGLYIYINIVLIWGLARMVLKKIYL